jgi:hypothetical protein
MAQLMVFRKKVVPTDTEYGDDISVTPGAKSTVSENLSEQISPGLDLYQTSAKFEPGSTRVFLNGVYMTNGLDYNEVGSRKISFIDEWTNSFIIDVTILSIFYTAK